MQIIQIIGERMYLDYLITNNFNFTYENNQINSEYHSQITIDEIEDKISNLNYMLETELSNENSNIDSVNLYKDCILLMNDLKSKLS